MSYTSWWSAKAFLKHLLLYVMPYVHTFSYSLNTCCSWYICLMAKILRKVDSSVPSLPSPALYRALASSRAWSWLTTAMGPSFFACSCWAGVSSALLACNSPIEWFNRTSTQPLCIGSIQDLWSQNAYSKCDPFYWVADNIFSFLHTKVMGKRIHQRNKSINTNIEWESFPKS